MSFVRLNMAGRWNTAGAPVPHHYRVFCTLYYGEVGLCSQGTRDRTRRNSLKLCQGRFKLDIEKDFLIERAAQKCGRVMVEVW